MDLILVRQIRIRMKRKIVIEIICCLFILLFTYAAISKVLDLQKFQIQLSQSPLLTAFAGRLVWAVPSVEIIISLMLAFPRFRSMALYACFSLMVMFTVYIVTILNFSAYIPCSCGGILEKLSWRQHLTFNVGFVLLALIGIILFENENKERLEYKRSE